MSKHILILSTADWNFKFWTNKQNVATELSKKGFKVLYVESPGIRNPNFFNISDVKRLIKKLGNFFFKNEKKNKNIKIISPPLVPFKERFIFLYKVYNLLLEKKILNELKKEKISHINLITYHPYFNFNKLNSYIKKLIYHCVDDLSSIKGINKKKFKLNEKKLIKKSNFIFTCCSLLFHDFKKLNKNVFFLKNAISNEFIDASKKKYKKIPNELKNLRRPIFGYHGIFSDFKLDFRIYYKLALKYKSSSFAFIGEEFELNNNLYFEKLKKLSNVHFINYKKYLDLPKYLKNIDYGLLLYKKNSYTQNMYPLKINELLACKTNVVINNVPSTSYFKKQIIEYKNYKTLMTLSKRTKLKKFDSTKVTYCNLVDTIITKSCL